MSIRIGVDRDTKRPVYFPPQAFERHLHMIGYTGAGKTTAIVTLLVNMLSQRSISKGVIVIDRLGGFSLDLLRWFSSSLLCPPWVRDRLIYIEPARENITLSLNPLLYDTPGEGYYRTARAAEIVLRGWDSQDLSKMPRLMRWLFNAMWAVAQLGLTLTDTQHLLFPQSPLHRRLLNCLPEALRYEWNQIIDAKGSQAEVQLESTRNRMKPYFDSPVLRAMFASPVNRFDVLNWIRDKKVVVVNLAPMGRLPEQSADAIGGLIVNEVFAIARSLPPEERREVLLVLDEFQRFVGPDLEFSLAESRQLKASLLLSHQSLSQLDRGDTDLTSLIFQAQSRLMLRVAGQDAKVLSEELAEFDFNPDAIKHEIYSRSQRVSGHKLVDLHSTSNTEALAHEWSRSHGTMQGDSRSQAGRVGDSYFDRVETRGRSGSQTDGRSQGQKTTKGTSYGTSQSFLPVFEEYAQLASRTYQSFDEQRVLWGQKLRKLSPGEGVLQIANDNRLAMVTIDRTTPAHLNVDWGTVIKEMPAVAENYYQLLETNFAQDCFVTPDVALRESERQLEKVLHGTVTINTQVSTPASNSPPSADGREMSGSKKNPHEC